MEGSMLLPFGSFKIYKKLGLVIQDSHDRL
jgi:hypothetical protein